MRSFRLESRLFFLKTRARSRIKGSSERATRTVGEKKNMKKSEREREEEEERVQLR